MAGNGFHDVPRCGKRVKARWRPFTCARPKNHPGKHSPSLTPMDMNWLRVRKPSMASKIKDVKGMPIERNRTPRDPSVYEQGA